VVVARSAVQRRLTFVRRLRGAVDGHVEVAQVVIVRSRGDALYRLLDEPLALLDDALRQTRHVRV
jgi:hypothetical protein